MTDIIHYGITMTPHIDSNTVPLITLHLSLIPSPTFFVSKCFLTNEVIMTHFILDMQAFKPIFHNNLSKTFFPFYYPNQVKIYVALYPFWPIHQIFIRMFL